LQVIPLGGVPPYSYAWTGPNNFSASVANPQNLVAGTYQVTVTDANGCTFTGAPQTIIEPSPLSLTQSQVNNTCYQGNTGSISITVTGGTAPYSYAWTGPSGFTSTDEELSTLVSGTYQVTVRDAYGCTITGAAQTITEPSPLSLTQSQVNNTCFQGNKGSISITATGGTAPYRYSWIGPNGFTSTIEELSTLVAGTYQVTVTDANGCTITGLPQAITQPSPLSLTQCQLNNTCFQGNTGSISITATGGTAPYSYAWTGPSGFTSTDEVLSTLVSGIYQVTVTDANGCTITGAPQAITEPSPLSLTQSQVNNTCFQGNTGSISITASGGTAPYSYAWTGPNGFIATDEELSTLVSGIYQVTVTDVNGCTITGAPQTITEPSPLSLTQSQVNNVCFQGNTGSISITATGGMAPYTYAWTGPNNFSSTVANLQNLVSGTYQVTVRDATNCIALVGPQITITEPPAITIHAQVQPESCADASDGRIELTLSGGTPPYALTWEHGGTDALASGLGAGTYRVRVTDQAGCSQVGDYTLLPIPPLSLQTTTTLRATQVPLQLSALLQANVTGGTPPYTYRWSTGQSTSQITVLESGMYGIEMLDSKGCSQESEVAVTVPLPINLSLQITTVSLCEEGGQETTVQLQLTDGLPPYQITWSRGIPSPDGRVLVTRESGVFTVEVKDALGLVEKRAFILAPRLTGPLDFSYLFASQAEFQGDLVGYAVNFSPQATWPFMVISWDFGDGSSSAVLNPSHRYAKKGTYMVTLTVLDDVGCLIKASQEIQVLDYFIEIPNVFTPNGDELNDTFFPKFRFIRNLQLQVMNTWGELIYRSQGQGDPGWDGLVSGQKAFEGVYVYKLRYQVPDGRTITSSSTFLLAR
jgi:gliding motility-associated-like protein